MEQNYFIIHGSYGNPYKNWIPSLKSQLSKRKLNCIVPWLMLELDILQKKQLLLHIV